MKPEKITEMRQKKRENIFWFHFEKIEKRITKDNLYKFLLNFSQIK